jgi:integrase
VRKGWCAQPEPSRLVFEFPRSNNIKTEDLGQNELDRLMKALDDEPNQKAANLMRLALYTGMRRGDAYVKQKLKKSEKYFLTREKAQTPSLLTGSALPY